MFRCTQAKGAALFVLALIAAIAVGVFWEVFPESEFRLADDSRLPNWIHLPAGVNRANSSVFLSYRSLPWGGRARLELKDSKNHVLQAVNGRSCALGEYSNYPTFEAVSVRGLTEIIEHRAMEPVFYVSDDPVWQRMYARSGCK